MALDWRAGDLSILALTAIRISSSTAAIIAWIVVFVPLLTACGSRTPHAQFESAPGDPCTYPIEAPISIECAVAVAEAGAVPARDDLWEAIEAVEMGPEVSQARFGIGGGADDEVAIVLLDVWHHNHLLWYTPPPEGPRRPEPGGQKVAAVFTVPNTTTLQVRVADRDLDAEQWASLEEVAQRVPLDWR